MRKTTPQAPADETRSCAISENRSYAGRSADERKLDRRQRLLAAGIDIYGTSGYRTATVKAVCQRAGLTERYFYESFNGSEELLCDACAQIMDALRVLAMQAAGATDGSPSKRIWAATQSYFSSIKANPAAARVILFEVEGVSAYADERLRQELEKTTDLIMGLLEEGRSEQPAPDLSPRLLARGLLGSLYQIAKEWTRSNFDLQDEVLVRHIHAISMGALQQLYPAPSPARCESGSGGRRKSAIR